MYFKGNNGYQIFLFFTPMLSSLMLVSNKKVAKWILTPISSAKTKPFDSKLESTKFNLANSWVALKFINSVLVQKDSSSSYSNYILNVYILYQLNNWPRNPTDNLLLKNGLFGTIKLARNAIKSKFTCNSRGITFDGEGSWSFGNDFAINVPIFWLYNTWPYHTSNQKNNFLVYGKGPTDGINDSTGESEKNSINVSKIKPRFIFKKCIKRFY